MVEMKPMPTATIDQESLPTWLEGSMRRSAEPRTPAPSTTAKVKSAMSQAFMRSRSRSLGTEGRFSYQIGARSP